MTSDRRRPVARYVEFRDPYAQMRFISTAEKVHRTLVAADQFGGVREVALHPDLPEPEPVIPQRRRWGRKPQLVVVEIETILATPALAQTLMIATTAPGEVAASPQACSSSAHVAQILGNVAESLAMELLEVPPREQADHPAYGQTLRLAAELQAVRDISVESTCTFPGGCVAVRSPGAWGRRREDDEVHQVREVLVQLALAGSDGRTPA